MPDRDLIADARQLANSIPEGIGLLRSMEATRAARARTLLRDLADRLEQALEYGALPSTIDDSELAAVAARQAEYARQLGIYRTAVRAAAEQFQALTPDFGGIVPAFLHAALELPEIQR